MKELQLEPNFVGNTFNNSNGIEKSEIDYFFRYRQNRNRSTDRIKFTDLSACVSDH